VLTGELLRVRSTGGALVPRYLAPGQRARLLPAAEELLTHARAAPAHHALRAELGAALEAVPHAAVDRFVMAGLCKLVLDRCAFAVTPGPEPAALRERTFRLAAERRRTLEPLGSFDRDAVLADVSAALARDGIPLAPAELDARLFADLPEEERCTGFRDLSAGALLDRYDLALAQGVLLRATRVTVWLEGEAPAAVRNLFRAARFHGLLHRVIAEGDGGWRVDLDGPFSLFSAVQRYGLALGLFLPAVLRCRRWRLEADLLWGAARRPMRFVLRPEHGLAAGEPPPPGLPRELAAFAKAFASLGSAWSVAPCTEILSVPGEPAVVPDLVFERAGERVYLEAFGYWSRAAVWRRIETLRRGFPARLLLAVGKRLRVSEQALEDEAAGELYVYREKMRPSAVLERLERLRAAALPRKP
jgi:predicted nuclease of restriction endonuclease-like RecB superfamily